MTTVRPRKVSGTVPPPLGGTGKGKAMGYFLDKARGVFTRAGGDPGNAGPLAQWAERARWGNDHWARVIVAESGEILAEAKYQGRDRPVPASYITSVAHESDSDLVRYEMGLAVGALARRHGTRAIVVTFAEVCLGPGLQARESE